MRLATVLAFAVAVATVHGNDANNSCHAKTCPEDPVTVAGQALLQRHASRAAVKIPHFEDGTPTAWVASVWGDCVEGCNAEPTSFRTVNCSAVFDDLVVPDKACVGPKPQNARKCNCATEGCTTRSPSECPRVEGVPAGTGGVLAERVGCFEFEDADQEDADDPLRPRDCEDAKDEEDPPCSGGVPFYANMDQAMNPEACMRFCLRKGLDIAGIHRGSSCRCGAAPVNRAVFSHGTPRKSIVFNPRSLKRSGSSGPCPLEVYRFRGPFEDGGVPDKLEDHNALDVAYVDSIVEGRNVGERQEEDGLPEEEMVEGLAQLESGKGPSFDRPCWPINCGPGRGPWRNRSATAPVGVKDVWDAYVTIQYTFKSGTDSARKAVFRAAAEEWRERTCINLIYVDRLRGPGITVGLYQKSTCWLSGMGHGTSQINLGWCNSMLHLGSAIHEIGHAVGLNHEQKRPDATRRYHGHGPFLKMFWNNIDSRWRPQYLPDMSSYTGSANDGKKDPHSGYAPYDFGSVMHYPGGSEFDTIPKDKEKNIGQRRTLSPGDVGQVLDVYQCHKKCKGSSCPGPAPGPTPAPTPRPPKPPAPAPAPSGPTAGSCNFESAGGCKVWSNSETDDFDWKRQKGKTPSKKTGPRRAADGKWYMYVEATGRKEGDSAVLTSTPLKLAAAASMNFKYHMNGKHVGKLAIAVRAGGGKAVSVFERSGRQGRKWRTASVDLSAFAGKTVTVEVVGIRGSGDQGDIAIDGVEFVTGG